MLFKRFYQKLLANIIVGLLYIPLYNGFADSLSLDLYAKKFQYNLPQTYALKQIQVLSTKNFNQQGIIACTGLKIGDIIQIPSNTSSEILKRIWNKGLVEDLKIYLVKNFQDSNVNLLIQVKEDLLLNDYEYIGLKKSEKKDLNNKLDSFRGKAITERIVVDIKNIVKKYFLYKGFAQVKLKTEIIPQSTEASQATFRIIVKKNKKIRIKKIYISGNQNVDAFTLKRAMVNTKEKTQITLLKNIFCNTCTLQFFRREGLFRRDRTSLKNITYYLRENIKINLTTSSKFIVEDYQNDKENLLKKLRAEGYLNSIILKDQIQRIDDKNIIIHLKVEENNPYYIRSIKFLGNYLFSSKELLKILNVNIADQYVPEKINQKMVMNPQQNGIMNFYTNKGYLTANIKLVEKGIHLGNQIDLEIHIQEGEQYYIRNVYISGNNRTHEYVIRRELETYPGDKFDGSKIMNSIIKLSQLGYFDPTKINFQPINLQPSSPETPNAKATVDLKYELVEKPNDVIKLSGGWGGQSLGLVANLSLELNNFATSNVLHFKNWNPLPAGDGQQLAISFQLNGKNYQQYNLSFSEPWLSKKKYSSLTVSSSYQRFRKEMKYNIYPLGESISIYEKILEKYTMEYDSIGFNTNYRSRLKWPDNYCISQLGGSYFYYIYKNYDIIGNSRLLTNRTNNLHFITGITRNSSYGNEYPLAGSYLEVCLKYTPPYSLFSSKDPDKITESKKLKWIEFQKLLLDYSLYQRLFDKFVFNVNYHFGILANLFAKNQIGPFERFYCGGSGINLSGSNVNLGGECISLKGYGENSIVPVDKKTKYSGGIIYQKYSAELRYPLLFSSLAIIYAKTFAEAANNFAQYKDFNLFDLKTSAGLGVKVITSMIGEIGFDWGYGFNEDLQRDKGGSQWHLSFGKTIR